MLQHTEFVPAFSKEEAIERGLKFFFSGKECRNGHLAVRDVTHDGKCIECIRANNRRAMEEYRKRDDRKEMRARHAKGHRERNLELYRLKDRVKYYKKCLDKSLDELSAYKVNNQITDTTQE